MSPCPVAFLRVLLAVVLLPCASHFCDKLRRSVWLGTRDCEESDQIWASCADITIGEH